MLSITRLFVMFSRAGSSAERIEEILQARSDIKNQDANDNKSCDESLPYIVFDNVSFSYNGNVDNLSDISFSLEKGQKLGIIGATGSGKTTIINLLMRFYDVSSGKIFIDGKDIRDYDIEGIYVNILYDPKTLLITTGISYKNFSLDKSLEYAFDEYLAKFLKEKAAL